jgi:preprotein translocase subunit SecD
MQKQRSLLALIVVLVIAAIVTIVKFPVALGLDLQGGSQLTIQVKPTEEIKQIGERELEAVKTVVENRVNGLGVSEPVIQTVGQDQILVQLPGVNDPGQAERVLGGTAQLDFRRENAETRAFVNNRQQQIQGLFEEQQKLENAKDRDEKAIAANKAAIEAKIQEIAELETKLFERTGLTGKNLKYAQATPTQVGNNWSVGLEFDAKGGELFAQLTKELAGTGRRLGIFLDDKPISTPVVGQEFAQTGITGGRAEITGSFNFESANELALQLRGGALPVPVEIVENRTVGATLGRDSVQRSIYAGVGGLSLVLIFMVVYYRLPGLIADVALVIYALLTWATFTLLGVTLTLPGIAGFILSIGMAVDANVLIFERTREELRAGKSLYRSVESGFYRAFSSILDSNVTTWIACAALFWLGSGLVKGFALTLALGVAVSMFTAITCSRTFLMLAIAIPSLRKPELYCPSLPASNKAQGMT